MPKICNQTYVLLEPEYYHLINWKQIHQDHGTCRQLQDGRYILSYSGEQPIFLFYICGNTMGYTEYTNLEIIKMIKDG